ncbi:MAG: PDDEXK nuclease domain-containing protein [Bacteroidota bacterium]|nr:PDDEXK nuclease domain-containing protein [Bacteroidota bacterium]
MNKRGEKNKMLSFANLSNKIIDIHSYFYTHASKAVNISLTLRNWLIGYYIVEYEQNGNDRAEYGTALLLKLEEKLKPSGIKGLSERRFRDYRRFYKLYPQIRRSLTAVFNSTAIRQLPTAELLPLDIEQIANHEIQERDAIFVQGDKILTKLSYSHLEQLIRIEDQLKRTFYEIECINGTWSVSELKRQIATIYFERSGLSKDKEKLSRLVHQKAEQLTPVHFLKNPMAFEFLDLPVKDILEESDIEQAVIDNLQMFLLELGNGFCFEARQKRILIDDEYFYIDLVFYHRILRSHVLIEIKNDEFKHEHIGQLEIYLQYYKHEIKQKHDRDPIGILLCTKSKKTMVKYATTAKENIFVNEYLINLPSKEKLIHLVEKWINQ